MATFGRALSVAQTVPVTKRRTAGDVTIGGTEQDVDTALDVVLPAQAGDVVDVGVSGFWDPAGSFAMLSAVSVVSNAIVRYLPNGGTATFGNGNSGWMTPVAGTSEYTSVTGSFLFTVQAGDLSNGTVTIRLRAKTSGGNRILRGNATDVLTVWARNVAPGVLVPAGTLLTAKSYNPGTVTTVSSNTSDADLDATNLAVTFTVPATGRVLCALTASCYSNAAGDVQQWLVRDGGVAVTGSRAPINSQGPRLNRHTHRFLITGLAPGTSKTWTWAAKAVSGSVMTRYGDDGTGDAGGPAVMEVWVA